MKNQIAKKALVVGLSMGLAFNSLGAMGLNAEAPVVYKGAYERPEFGQTPYNYAEALQKSLYFYDANKCGPGITGGKLEWRGDCHVEDQKKSFEETDLSDATISKYKDILDPDGDGCIDVSGGFHDAGDHVRFGMPQSYSASTLGWGYNEFKKGFEETGTEEHMLDILKWYSDCFLRNTWLDKDNNLIAHCYMVGEGGEDHRYWEAPELQRESKIPRPADFATVDHPASDQCAGAAAALATMYVNYKAIDKKYADECLLKAKALYEYARKYQGMGNGDGFYTSGFAEDELSWAAVWLYEATGNQEYINHIISKTKDGIFNGYMKKIISTTENTWQNIWVHCWDVVWGGVFTKLASMDLDFVTQYDRDMFDYFSRWNLEYWSGGFVKHDNPADTVVIQPTPAGYALINTWGSARYNTAAQLCTLVYQKHHPEQPKSSKLAEWAKRQMNYLMGDNPMGYSYIVGFTDKSAMRPHHRAAHGSKTLNMLDPENQVHTLWGALVGGPDTSDKHVDKTYDYVYNEVAIDYNAGMVGALAGHYLLYEKGDKPLTSFPPKEAEIDEIYAQAKLEQVNNERTQVSVIVNNDSIHPPRLEDKLSMRYYFNIKELLDAGQTINDVKMEIYYDEVGTTIKKGPVKVDDKGNYYIEFDWSGTFIYGDRELQFALVAKQDSNWKANWNANNDFSYQGLKKGEKIKVKNIPVYSNGKLVWGEEPKFE